MYNLMMHYFTVAVARTTTFLFIHIAPIKPVSQLFHKNNMVVGTYSYNKRVNGLNNIDP